MKDNKRRPPCLENVRSPFEPLQEYMIMAYSTDAWQARLNDKRSLPIEEIATNSSTKPTSNIRAVEISFYQHEIYAGEKLLAKITYDSNDFVTQPWLVIINGVEIHRANTWAKCYNYITWHYKQETLPMQQQEVETGSSENACVILPAFIAYSEQTDWKNFDSILLDNILRTLRQEESCLIYFPLSKNVSTKYSRCHNFTRKDGTHKVNSCNNAVIAIGKKGGSKWLRKLNWGFVIHQSQSICMLKMANLVVNLIYGISTISITIKRFLFNNEL